MTVEGDIVVELAQYNLVVLVEVIVGYVYQIIVNVARIFADLNLSFFSIAALVKLL